MKIFAIHFVVLIMCSCANTYSTAQLKDGVIDKNIALLNATASSWVPGRANATSGTNYLFSFLLKTNKPLRFDSAWLKNGAIKMNVYSIKDNEANTQGPFKKGDTLYVKGASIVKYEGKAKQTHNVANPPKKFKGEALLRYWVGKHPNYVEIQTIAHKTVTRLL
ncbi:hypothetical protein [Parasediminibacterium sp. JCM 36343]|uniref:hypothetical protein n=1 Tax=Parasediminibacterium sp. JCM 36343 TaxID=3374279 RepID=UPI00397E7B30